MKGLHGIIFSYEKHNSLRELTANRMPASVPFAGRYRIIDFVLSSMVNAGITDVGVVLHGNYQSLLDHLGSGKDWDLSRKHGGLRLLPPFSYEETGGVRAFRGKMEALAGVRSYLEGVRQSHVVLADSDLIVNIPLQEVYQAHLDSGADITAVCTSSVDGPDDVTYFRLDGEGRITETLYPLNDPTGCYRSLEMYILSKDLLLELVDECMSHDLCSFRGAVLQAKAGALNIRSFVWDGYAAQIHTLKDYYVRSMELLDPTIRREIFHPQRPIHTKERGDQKLHPHAGHRRPPRRRAPPGGGRQERGDHGLPHPHGPRGLSHGHLQGEQGVTKSSPSGQFYFALLVSIKEASPHENPIRRVRGSPLLQNRRSGRCGRQPAPGPG